ncbi:MAG: transglutaminase-like domain-containing protein [Phycisphaerae bacterium]
MRFFLIVIGIVFALAGNIFAFDVNNPPQGRFNEQWMEVHMLGGKVGYAQSTFSRDGDVITSTNRMFMRVGRVDQPVEIESEQWTKETLEGKPLAFAAKMKAATMDTETRGEIADGKVTVTTAQFGMEQKQTHPFAGDGVMSWGVYRASILAGIEPGKSFKLKVYTPELRLDAPVDVETTMFDWETFDNRGEQLRGLKSSSKMITPMGEMEIVAWLDKDGLPVRSIFPMPGLGNIEIYAVDKAKALADFVPPEMFMTSTIPVKRSIDRKKSREIVYEISAKDGESGIGTFPTTGMQKVSAKGKIQKLVVTRQEYTSAGRQSGQLSAAEHLEYTGSNLMMNLDDPELKALAKKAVGDEKDPYKLADKLRVFVTDYISDKNLDVAFATASEVCRNKSGDCSEHGVLLAALGRLAGFPSRVVVGLAYVPLFGAQQDIYGYHMWTQFYIDGRWLDYDAALRETSCSPARIAMAVSSMQNAGMAELTLPMIKKIGAIDMKIVTVDGK